MSTQKLDQGHSIDTRAALLEQSINNINDTMVRFEKRFDKIDSKVDELTKEIRRSELSLRYDLASQFKWIMGLIVISILIPISLHALKLI